MTRTMLLLASLALLSGCSGDRAEDGAATADTITQRQRDSIVGESGLPGARGVRGALDASDAAAARAERVDSAAGGG